MVKPEATVNFDEDNVCYSASTCDMSQIQGTLILKYINCITLINEQIHYHLLQKLQPAVLTAAVTVVEPGVAKMLVPSVQKFCP